MRPLARWLPIAALSLLALVPPATARELPKIPANRTAHVWPAESRAKWARLVEAKNPAVLYGESITGKGNPAWYAQRGPIQCLMTYHSTGEPEWLADAIDPARMMPDVSTSQRDHLSEISWLLHYELLRPHLTPELDAEWQRRLRVLGDECIAKHRLGDWDQCVTYAIYLKCCDKLLGTSYQQHANWRPLEEWVNSFMREDSRKGGLRDPSSGYETSTTELIFWGAAIYGKDVFPWFDAWAREYADALAWTVSSDLKAAVHWGDQQGDDGSRLSLAHRIPGTALAVGLGYGDRRVLLSQLHGWFKQPLSDPMQLYPYGGMLWQLVLDPELLVSAERGVPMPQGVKVFEGIGLVVYRDARTLAWSDLGATINPEGVPHVGEDHGYWRIAPAVQIYRDGEWPLGCPSGYAEGNAWDRNNSFALRHLGLWDKRQYLGTETSAGGFLNCGRSSGPYLIYARDEAGVTRPPGQHDFLGSQVEYSHAWDAASLTLRETYEWKADPKHLPAWSAHLPMFRLARFATAEPVIDGQRIVWTTAGGCKMTTLVEMPAAKFEVRPLGVINQHPWWQVIIASPVDQLAGKARLTTVVGAHVEAPPQLPPLEPPPPPPPPVDPPPLPMPPPPVEVAPKVFKAGGVEWRLWPDRLERVEVFPLAP